MNKHQPLSSPVELAKHTWLSPMAVVTIAEPRPVVTLTLIPPIILHTMMYHNILFLPYLPRLISGVFCMS